MSANRDSGIVARGDSSGQNARMGTSGDSSRRDGLTVVSRDDRDVLAQAIALGNENKRTLGFLPHKAYEQACDSGTLLAIVEHGRVMTYALYSLPRQVVRLTHLCVNGESRGRGLRTPDIVRARREV